jgi:Domain of unknown function (DUF4157)
MRSRKAEIAAEPKARTTTVVLRAGLRSSHPVARLLRIHRAVGNRGMGRLLEESGLSVGPAVDHHEREAGRVARRVASRIGGSAGLPAPARAGGALPDAVRAPLEQAFGSDFGDVRIHADERADQLNQALHARAFTTGRDIYFARRAYDPRSRAGLETLAHELTHVLQQRGSNRGAIQRQLVRVTEPEFEGMLYYTDTRNTRTLFEPLVGQWNGWYLDLQGNNPLWYYPHTKQYLRKDQQWWDPVTGRTFTSNGQGWYVAGDGTGYWYYDGTNYQPAQQAQQQPAVDQNTALEWVKKNIFTDKRQSAIQNITGYVYLDRKQAWKMVEYWNIAYPQHTIDPTEVKLDPATKQQDLAAQQQPHVQATEPKFTSKSYKLRSEPEPGSRIPLPSIAEVKSNLDLYWRGRGDETGGAAAERKTEKHDVAAGIEAFEFARAPGRKWFVQHGNRNTVIFHNYPATTVYMAVWDWTLGAMVTYYPIDPWRVGGDVGEYLRARGMP